MNLRIFLVFLAICLFVLCLVALPVKSQNNSVGFIFIQPDGSVEPLSAPIQRADDVYTFTANINDPIVIERNHMILDGAGHYLQGNSEGIGINITASNVTIMNLQILHWKTGILGAYNGNNIKGNYITNCNRGIRINGNNYTIAQNYLANNGDGVFLYANATIVSRNTLIDNHQGINIAWYNHKIMENNLSNIDYDIAGGGLGGVTIYRNNFLKTNPKGYVLIGTTAAWDNGTEGNFWKNGYKGSDANGDGIGDDPYNIGYPIKSTADGTSGSGFRVMATDNHPLMRQVIVELPPQASPSPPPSPTPTPSPNQTLPASTIEPAPKNSSTPQQPPPPSEQPENLFSLDAVLPIVIIVVAFSTAAVFVIAKRRLR